MLISLKLMQKYLKKFPDIDTKNIDDFVDSIVQEIDIRYIERPKDLTGHYIHINDELEDRQGKKFTVSSMELIDDGSWLISGPEMLGYENANHDSIIEDMLGCCVDECNESENTEEKNNIIKKYSEKLQLKDK